MCGTDIFIVPHSIVWWGDLMTNPVLESPADNASFFHDEIICFAWDVDPAFAAPVKFDLYVGPNPEKLYEDPTAIRKRWLFTPGSAWSSFNETPEILGLQPGGTYYWQVVREQPGHGMTLFSDVRSFHVRKVHTKPPPGFQIRFFHNKRVRAGIPFKIRMEMVNGSSERVRLHYATEEHVAVEIYATRGILSDKYVWPIRKPLKKKPHYIEIEPGRTEVEEIIWDQHDIKGKSVMSGSYRAVVHSLAVEDKGKIDIEFVIQAGW